MKTLARYVKHGYLFDPDDSRTTHRLRVAHGILLAEGVESHVEHQAPEPFRSGCAKHPTNANRGVHYPGYCSDQCRTVWPGWVTDEMFDLAATAAEATQTLRGMINRAKPAEVRL